MMVRVRVNAEEHAVKMLSELHRMQQDRLDCDLKIKVENDVYHTHRNVMASGSVFIRDMLAKKSHLPSLSFENVDSECVKNCIDFFYTGELEIPDDKISIILAIVAKLQMDGAMQVIAGILAESLNVENYFMTRTMADRYGLKEVYVKCQSFFEENLIEIANRPQFGRMSIVKVVCLMTEGGKCTEHDKLIVLLKWAEKNPLVTHALLYQIQQVRLDNVPPLLLRYLLKSHPIVSNNLAIYKLISDHLLEVSEKLIEENESYRSGKDQGNSSDVGNTCNDNKAQLHAVVIKEEQIDSFALPAIPNIQYLRQPWRVTKRNVLSENNRRVTVTTPFKRRWPYSRKCRKAKVESSNENCPNKALMEALTNLLVNKTPDDIAIDHEGFAHVDDILKHRRFRRFSLSEKDVYDFVKNDNGSRFAIKGEVGNFQVQAIYGHPPDSETDSVKEDGSDLYCRVTKSVPGMADA